jgi:tellurite resistance-related uncharacterized protein
MTTSSLGRGGLSGSWQPSSRLAPGSNGVLSSPAGRLDAPQPGERRRVQYVDVVSVSDGSLRLRSWSVGSQGSSAMALVTGLLCWIATTVNTSGIVHRCGRRRGSMTMARAGSGWAQRWIVRCAIGTEIPTHLVVVRTTPLWDEHSMPNALRRAHRVASGLWGRLRIEEGDLRFVAQTTPVVDVVVDHRHPQSIPPDVEHFVEPQGPVRFSIAFLAPQE